GGSGRGSPRGARDIRHVRAPGARGRADRSPGASRARVYPRTPRSENRNPNRAFSDFRFWNCGYNPRPPMKKRPVIVVAPNAFKETFSPVEAARLISRGLRRALDARIVPISVADGGDGTLEALRSSLGGRKVFTRVTGPLGT